MHYHKNKQEIKKKEEKCFTLKQTEPQVNGNNLILCLLVLIGLFREMHLLNWETNL